MATEAWDDAADTGLSKDTMPSGVYEVQIRKWKGKPYDKDGQKGRILELKLELLSVPEDSKLADKVGEEMEAVWWLTRPVSKRIFFDELKDIGFDTDAWSDDKDGEFPKGTMLPLAIKYAKLRGLTLKMERSADKSGKYGNLRFVGRTAVNGSDSGTIPNDAVLAVADEPEEMEDVF